MPSPLANALCRYVPALESLRTYSLHRFQRDLFAGLTVAAVAVPQAMAYASIFGMPVEMGLYTAIVMTTVGALLDSSKQLINGPTNAISIAMLSALAVVPEEQRIQGAIMMAFFIGLIQTAIAVVRFGDLSRFISHAVIVGFTLGASVLLFLDQLKNFLGMTARGDDHDHFLWRTWGTLSQGDISWTATSVASLTVVTALLFRLLNKKFKLGLPELLLAIVVSSTLLYLADPTNQAGVKLQPAVPKALPTFQLPVIDWTMARNLSTSAAAIALLGLLEAMAMAKAIASKTREKLDMNQQCLSEGLANMAGSFFRCFPGSGSLTRSYINHTAGAATQWSGVFSAVGVAATILVLAPFAEYIPKAALAGVLILTATRMNDLKTLSYFWNATKFDRGILVATALSAIFISVEFCILIGIFLSFAFYVPRAAKLRVSELIVTRDRIVRETTPNDLQCSFVRIYNFEGEMFFGCATELDRQLICYEELLPDTLRVVILRLKRANNPDAVCMEVLQRFIERMHERNVVVLLSGTHAVMTQTLVNVGIDQVVGPDNVFREESEVWVSTVNAIKKAYSLIGNNRCLHCPNREIARADHNDWSYMI